MKKYLLYLWYKFASFPFRLLPIKNNRILVENFFGKGFGDSPKYIVKELLNGKTLDLEVIWLVKGKFYTDIPSEIKQVKRGTLAELYYLSTSKVWIDNERKHLGVVKRRKQYYIQTWHSPLRLKKIEMDACENLTEFYKKTIKHDSKNMDLISAGCDFSYNIYKRAFLYNGEIAKFGTPRCDIFFDKEYCEKISRKIHNDYSIDKDSKIILYAPTFRNNTNFSNIIPDLDRIVKELNKIENTIILYRFHPNTKFEYCVNNKKIIDVTKYPDMQDLICVADILITDYSSCCFDMLIADKPCILYIPDIEDYLKRERELYFEFKELPFEKAINENELVVILKNLNIYEYNKKVYTFNKKINLYEDGQASHRISERIKKVINNEKI